MQENNKPIVAKGWICKHANGINPLDGSTIPDGDIVERTFISNFVNEINNFVPGNMKPVSFRKILSWLMANDYLEEIEVDAPEKMKKPTALDNSIGISAELRVGVNGSYWAVEYNPTSHHLILNNIYAIAES